MNYYETFDLITCKYLKVYVIQSAEVSPCDSNPCPNNMTCARDGANYTCECMAGFTGLNCENGKVLNRTC